MCRYYWLAWWAGPIGLAYGAADELTQTLVGRTCAFDDWAANAVGTAVGLLIVLALQRLVRTRRSEFRDSANPSGETVTGAVGE